MKRWVMRRWAIAETAESDAYLKTWKGTRSILSQARAAVAAAGKRRSISCSRLSR